MNLDAQFDFSNPVGLDDRVYVGQPVSIGRPVVSIGSPVGYISPIERTYADVQPPMSIRTFVSTDRPDVSFGTTTVAAVEDEAEESTTSPLIYLGIAGLAVYFLIRKRR